MSYEDENTASRARSLLSALSNYYPKVENQWYHNQQINIDGYNFQRCRFDNCKIITSKGSFSFDHCFFSNCTFMYNDEALKIVKLYNVSATEARSYWPALAPTINEDGTLTVQV
jgi:hypothetical protein